MDYTGGAAVRAGLLLINGVMAIWGPQGGVTRHCLTSQDPLPAIC